MSLAESLPGLCVYPFPYSIFAPAEQRDSLNHGPLSRIDCEEEPTEGLHLGEEPDIVSGRHAALYEGTCASLTLAIELTITAGNKGLPVLFIVGQFIFRPHAEGALKKHLTVYDAFSGLFCRNSI